jgi:hypothetical protein
MKFEKAFEAFVAFLETLSVAMTAAHSTNPVVDFFRCKNVKFQKSEYTPNKNAIRFVKYYEIC